MRQTETDLQRLLLASSYWKSAESVQVPDKRIFTLQGEHVMTTQDWGPDIATPQRLGSLAPETYVIGSAREPGLVVDAIRDGALTGYSI